jgi:Ca2+-binding RTX toxin-like protein
LAIRNLTSVVLPILLAYYDVEVLDISMGSQDIVLNVRGTTAETFIKTQDSDDTVFVSSDANEVISTAGSVDFLEGWLDYIESDLHIEVSTGRHRLMMSDESSSKSKGIGSGGPAALTEDSLVQLSDGLGDIFFKATGGNWFGGVNLWLGQNADSLNVLSIPSAASTDLQTSTSLHCGSGDDTVTISLDETSLEEVVFVANGQAGDDVIDASASSLPVILFGDDGNDTLTGGSGNDIIVRILWSEAGFRN